MNEEQKAKEKIKEAEMNGYAQGLRNGLSVVLEAINSDPLTEDPFNDQTANELFKTILNKLRK